MKANTKQQETTCAQCGKVFRYYPSHPRKYCSRECADAGRTGQFFPRRKRAERVSTTCPTCGKPFDYLASWPRKYCSRVCAGKANIVNTGRLTGTRHTATCEQCGAPFETVPSQPGRFCSRACFGAWKSAHVRGETHPRAGVKTGIPAPNAKPPVMLTCPVCQGTFAVKPSQAARRRFCSRECHGASQAEAMRGEANVGWNGGYEPYYGPSWREAMRLARRRDRVCQDCGIGPDALGRELDVHHLKPFKAFGLHRHEEANTLANLVSLCPSCHLRREWTENRRLAWQD